MWYYLVVGGEEIIYIPLSKKECGWNILWLCCCCCWGAWPPRSCCCWVGGLCHGDCCPIEKPGGPYRRLLWLMSYDIFSFFFLWEKSWKNRFFAENWKFLENTWTWARKIDIFAVRKLKILFYSNFGTFCGNFSSFKRRVSWSLKYCFFVRKWSTEYENDGNFQKLLIFTGQKSRKTGKKLFSGFAENIKFSNFHFYRFESVYIYIFNDKLFKFQ